ncbi:hypothetical protein RB195_001136 [Necator americanus]
MRLWLNTLLAAMLLVIVTALEPFEDEFLKERPTRAFPFLLRITPLIGYDRRYGSKVDKVPLSTEQIDSTDGVIARMRRDGHMLKRYTCRFKFCRIFDE